MKNINRICLVLFLVYCVAGDAQRVFADSLWTGVQATTSSYFGEQPVGDRSVHDIILVLIDEATTANAKADTESEKKFELQGEVSSWFTLSGLKNIFNLLSPGANHTITGREDSTTNLPVWGATIDSKFEGEGESTRVHNVRSKIAAGIIEILPNGHLVLEARRQVKINQETLLVMMTGVARPEDVDEDNQILSSRIADLSFSVSGKGDVSGSAKAGLITRVFSLLN